MSQGSSYFQFPLCALAYGSNFEQRISHAMDYAIVRIGLKKWNDLSPVEQEFKAVEIKESEQLKPYDFTPTRHHHCAIVWGADLTNTRIGDIESVYENYLKLERHREFFHTKYGRDVEVRIGYDLMFAAYKAEFAYRHFSVICAVNSCIGANSRPVRITRQMIRTRQLGYKSAAVMAQEMTRHKKRLDKAEPLTERQIRDTLDCLEENGYFTRVNPSPRKVYFSTSMNREELKTAVAKMIARGESFQEQKQRVNQLLRAEIQKEKQALLGSI